VIDVVPCDGGSVERADVLDEIVERLPQRFVVVAAARITGHPTRARRTGRVIRRVVLQQNHGVRGPLQDSVGLHPTARLPLHVQHLASHPQGQPTP
jgi:hypothetical protein